MDSLPNDIICNIFRATTVPVDTYLAYRTHGVTPNKIVVPDNVRARLSKMLTRRQRGFDEYKRVMKATNGFSFITRIDQVFKRVNENTTFEMQVVEREGMLLYNFMCMRLPANLVGVSMRRTASFDMHSGQEVAGV